MKKYNIIILETANEFIKASIKEQESQAAIAARMKNAARNSPLLSPENRFARQQAAKASKLIPKIPVIKPSIKSTVLGKWNNLSTGQKTGAKVAGGVAAAGLAIYAAKKIKKARCNKRCTQLTNANARQDCMSRC